MKLKAVWDKIISIENLENKKFSKLNLKGFDNSEWLSLMDNNKYLKEIKDRTIEKMPTKDELQRTINDKLSLAKVKHEKWGSHTAPFVALSMACLVMLSCFFLLGPVAIAVLAGLLLAFAIPAVCFAALTAKASIEINQWTQKEQLIKTL